MLVLMRQLALSTSIESSQEINFHDIFDIHIDFEVVYNIFVGDFSFSVDKYFINDFCNENDYFEKRYVQQTVRELPESSDSIGIRK